MIKKIRLTLDYKEDLLQLNKIFKAFKSIKEFTLKDVLNYLKNKKVVKINCHLNLSLIEMKLIQNYLFNYE